MVIQLYELIWLFMGFVVLISLQEQMQRFIISLKIEGGLYEDQENQLGLAGNEHYCASYLCSAKDDTESRTWGCSGQP